MEAIARKRIYLFFTFTMMCSTILGIAYHFSKSPVTLTLMMFTPAFCSVLTRILTREGFKNMYLKVNIKGNLKWYFSAWFLTPLIAYFGVIVYFIMFKCDFNPLASELALAEGITSMSDYAKHLLILIPLAVLINPIMGLVQCFGEELGWRGYLLPKLTKGLSKFSATIITGLIWGIWHIPIILSGYNYGGEHPLLGSLAMIVFCVIIGVFSAFLFYKVKSIWVPVIFHASINGVDLWKPTSIFMSKNSNPFVGPELTGIIGGCGFIFGAIIIVCTLKIKSKRK